MKTHWTISRRTVLMLALILLLIPTLAWAGCYSDHCANQRSGSTSSNLTLKYGGTHGQAATNYMNYRHGYGTGSNNHYYSPYVNGGGAAPAPRPMTPQQQYEYNRAMRNADALMNRINNDPRLNGGYTGQPMTPQQQYQFNRSMQNADALMNRINNDPMVNGRPRPMTYQERMQYNRSMQQVDNLINRINNDPLINGGPRY